MALPIGFAALLIDAHRQRPFSGRLLQLGRQDVYFSLAELEKAMARYGFAPANAAELAAVTDRSRPLTDVEFFGIFGFTGIDATDVANYEGVDFLSDLNADGIPADRAGLYGCVLDGGTLEHVFHVPNALRNISGFLARDGRVIHINPASNAVDHGFYSFSPCLFPEYYRTNGFRVEVCSLLDLGSRLRPIRVSAYPYGPELPRSILDGYLPGKVHYVFTIASKTPESVSGRIPQQQFYVERWNDAEGRSAAADTAVSLWERLRSVVARNAGLKAFLRRRALPLVRLERILSTRMTLRRLRKRY